MVMNQMQSQAKTTDYNMRVYNGDVMSYTMMQFKQSVQKQNDDKLEKFKKRIDEFKQVSTLKEAKELAAKIMPVKEGKSSFIIGEAKCIIINREDVFRICINSPKEFISYDFV